MRRQTPARLCNALCFFTSFQEPPCIHLPCPAAPCALAHTLSPLAAAVLLLACGTALAQGTPADTSAPKALGEVTIKAAPQGDSYTPTATSTATKGSAPCAMCRRP